MKIACFVGIAALAGSAAAQISQVPYGSLSGTGLETFNGYAGGAAPGTNYDGVVSNPNVSFAERFVGQTLSFTNEFDTVSGLPSGTLALQTGAASQNLCIFDFNTNVITGLGRTGFPDFGAIGEGALAFLFTVDQGEFGFELLGGDGGAADVSFYKRDGSLIQTINLTGLANFGYGFLRDGGASDIAGVLIQNTDGGGIGLENLRFTIPTPGTAMVLVAAGLVGGRRRR